MPIANIHVLAGHPRPVLKQLLREVSATYAEVTGSPMDRLQVWITEIDPELYAIAGVPADECLAQGDRADLEIPLVRLVLLADRPMSQVHDAIREVSATVARVLGGDPDRVRVEVQPVEAARWGIGGVPATIKRAADLAARKRAANE